MIFTDVRDPSGLTILNRGVESFEFKARISGGELPVNFDLTLVTFGLPGSDLGLKGSRIRNTPVQALAAENPEFNFRQVEPRTRFGRIVNLQTLCDRLGFSRFKCRIE